MNLLELAVKIFVDDQATEKIRGMASTVGGGLATAAKVGGAAMAAASGATLAFGKSAVDTGMSFDSSMSQVAATMGKTTDQIGDLRDFAQQMGATTAFSATQAADALNYMALAGYDSKTSMEMLPNVLNLAAAGGMDLATASDMVTDAQSALGLSLDETSEMVDKMAKASSTTNTSVAQLGEAFLTVGGTAKNLSGGTTELAQALGLLADNGVKGSEGGTALRNIILSLSAPTDIAAKKLQELGVQAFDADGNMRPLEDTFADLNGALGKLTQEQQTQALNEIFNKVDLKSVNALLGTSAERWDEVAGKINDSKGAAEAMAKTQLDNLAGDVTLLKSAFEGFQIAISDQVTPSIRDFVQLASDSFSEFTTSFKEGGIDGLMASFSDAIEKGVAMVGEKLPGFLDAGGRVLGAVATGLANAAPSLVVGIGNALADMLNALAEGQDDMMMGGTDLLSKLADAVLEVGPKVFIALMNLLGSMIISVVEHGPEMLEAAGTLLNNVVDAIGIGAGDILAEMGRLVGDMLVSVGGEADRMAEEFGNLVQSGVDAVGGFFQDMFDAGANLVQGLVDGVLNAPANLADALSGVAGDALGAVTGFFGIQSPSTVMAEVGNNIMQGLANGVNDGAPTAEGAMDGAARGALGAISGLLNAAQSEFAALMGQDMSAMVGEVSNTVGPLSGAGGGIMSALVSTVGGYFGSMQSAAGSVIGAVVSEVQGGQGPSADGMAVLVSGLANAVSSGAYGVTGQFSSMMSDAVSAVSSVYQGLYDAGANIVAGLANGISGNMWTVADTLLGGLSDAVNGALSWLGIASPSKRFAWIGEMTMRGAEEGIASNAGRLSDAVADAVQSMQDAASAGVTIGVGAEYGQGWNGAAAAARAPQAAYAAQPTVVININDPVIKEEADADRILDYVEMKIQRRAGMLQWNPSASMAWS